MLVFSQAGCGIFKELIAECGMEHVKNDHKTSFSKIFVVFADKGRFVLVH